MNGREFLSLAVDLAAGTTEAAWRTSISRAYYAAFHVARRLLRDLGFMVPREDKAHAFLYFRLNNCGHPVIAKSASDLNYLRSWRNQADYEENQRIDAKTANDQIPIAQAFIQALDHLTPAERIQIRDAMIVYERDVLQNVTWHP